LLLKLEQLPFPTIASIHGACLGGGLELALACTYRIATDHPKTQIGLPEVSLGIIPGWGGTQRAPRLMGLTEGLNLVVSGKPIKAQKAWKLHLVDSLMAWEFKEEKTLEFVNFCLTDKGRKEILNRRKPTGLKYWLLEANPLGRTIIFDQAKKQILSKTKGFYPAPLVAWQVIKDSYGLPLEEGLKIESKGILDNMKNASDISKNLIDLFFTSEALKKETWVSPEIKPGKINSTAVLGAGVMGSGITWLLSQNDYSVRMKDVDFQAIGKGLGAISEIYHKAVKDKRLKKYEAELKFQHISGTVDYTGFQHVDLVIEAAVENRDLKNQIFLELETHIPSETIVATNTSSLGVSEMSKVFKHPERFIGMHFFNPVPRMPLVEVVPGPQTSPQTVATAVDFCKKLNKTPIVVGDCLGFLVNRIFAIGANELILLFEEGVDREKIDKLMLGFGYPMGPFTLADEVGIDVMAKVNKIFESSYGERMKGPKLLQEMYEKKWWGKKVNKGFYLYDGSKPCFNPEVLNLLGKPVSATTTASEIEMSDRVMLGMINEAARCLEEKIISRPDYLDMALILGTGFPPFRGGLLKYADKLGINYVGDHLKKFEQKYGVRFAPCDLVLDMISKNRSFYGLNI
jgi:3-hydroxyacyl-CoA dehydrogenase/enoyl-CoA hydratase/3-hydroxybutyryl-CoA epimerase